MINLTVCLFQYDQKGRLKRKPLVLEGGLTNWKLHYPMFVGKSGDFEDIVSDEGSIESGYSSDLSGGL